MILYTHASGPNPKKIQILMNQLAIPHKLEVLEFGDGEKGVKNAKFLSKFSIGFVLCSPFFSFGFIISSALLHSIGFELLRYH